jgi:hypothetical protein
VAVQVIAREQIIGALSRMKPGDIAISPHDLMGTGPDLALVDHPVWAPLTYPNSLPWRNDPGQLRKFPLQM